MAAIDDQIKAWLKDKFLQSTRYFPQTQGGPDDIEVLSVDTGWACGCYSQYTRDDRFKLEGRLKGANGREFTYVYSQWGDLPQLLTELDEYINGSNCPYDEENGG